MVFSSFVFLLAFLPITLILYYICPPRFRNIILLVASLIFYAWGEPVYVLIMLFSTVFDYTNGRLIDYFKSKDRLKAAKVTLIIDLCGNLAILGFFKYSDFFLGTLNSIGGFNIKLLGIALPIGISFYTFQTMSYTIDVYRGVVSAQKNILNFATYVVLFPQLIAGPIVQYKTIGEELSHRKVDFTDFSDGAFRFTVGFAKKMILANQAGALWDTISVIEDKSTAMAWLGAVAFSFQIYFDFAGYSDMAIGLGRMFGFHFLDNFNFPYMSRTVTEFWRRWHISLGSWFREYVYIPLGGNRKGLVRQIRNIVIVWALTGLWHGASWNFVVWGLYYGFLLMLEKLFLYKFINKIPAVFGHIYTVLIAIVGWTIFKLENFGEMKEYLLLMFGGKSGGNDNFLYYLSCNAVLLIVLVLCSIDHRAWLSKFKLGQRIIGWTGTAYNSKESGMAGNVARLIVMLVLLVVSFAFLVGSNYNPFLYFRF